MSDPNSREEWESDIHEHYASVLESLDLEELEADDDRDLWEDSDE